MNLEPKRKRQTDRDSWTPRRIGEWQHVETDVYYLPAKQQTKMTFIAVDDIIVTSIWR